MKFAGIETTYFYREEEVGIDAVKFVLKNINQPVVPLYDEKNQTFAVIADGDIVEIPRNVFLNLFKVLDAATLNDQIDTITRAVPMFKDAHSVLELQSQIQNWFSAAQNKEEISKFIDQIISDLSDGKKED